MHAAQKTGQQSIHAGDSARRNSHVSNINKAGTLGTGEPIQIALGEALLTQRYRERSAMVTIVERKHQIETV